jgi:hypothetical protein
MRLGLFNSQNKYLNAALAKSYETIDIITDLPKDLDAAFIDWVPIQSESNPVHIKQITLVTEFAKKKPVIVFDRHLGITPKEYELMVKNNVYLFEPAVKYRPGFSWMPFSTVIKGMKTIPYEEMDYKNKNRIYDLVYRGNLTDKIKSFEKYYIDFARVYPNKGKVIYHAILDKEKIQEYKLMDVNDEPVDFTKAKTSLIIGSSKDYMIGHLGNNFVEALDNNCVPMIPAEHRFFAGFGSYIEKVSEILIHTKSYNTTCVGLILDIYETIKKNYPEMDVKYSVDQIDRILR